jgi:2-amino-4-hydroxy-6-hydroxymethyldihydropteridine diphosphokinase
VKAFLALGSNLGDRLEHLRAALRALEALPGTRVKNTSRIFETEPVGGPDQQGAYLNAVVQIETRLKPQELLKEVLEIERSRGRVRTTRWGPRTLDLDVLLYGTQVIHLDHLTVPHPRLHERAFVLEPLHDLAPDLEIPGLGITVAALRERVDRSGVWASDLTF